MRVLLAASHPVVRRGIRQVLLDGIAACTVRDARDSDEIEASVGQEAWDLVVLGLSMADRPDMEILSRIRCAVGNRTPIIAVSLHSEREFTRSAIRAGASAVLLAERVDEDLVKTVHLVRRGEALLKVGLL